MKVNGKRLVLIEWEDSLGVGQAWETLTEMQEPENLICYSAGWLIVDGEKAKVIVPHIHEPDEDRNIGFNGVGDMIIPTSAVRRIVDLRAK